MTFTKAHLSSGIIECDLWALCTTNEGAQWEVGRGKEQIQGEGSTMKPVGLGREVGEGTGDVTRVLIGVPKSTDDIL